MYKIALQQNYFDEAKDYRLECPCSNLYHIKVNSKNKQNFLSVTPVLMPGLLKCMESFDISPALHAEVQSWSSLLR